MQIFDGVYISDGVAFGPEINPNLVVLFSSNAAISNYAALYFYDSPNVPSVDVNIDWGDGNTDVVNFSSSISHVYETDGLYTINITGNSIGQFGLGFEGMLGVLNWGNMAIELLDFAFSDCPDFIIVPNSLPPTVTNLYSSFQQCYSFNDSNIASWDTSNISDMRYVFEQANSFNQLINNWNISNIDSTEGIFYYASNFNQPLNLWNTANITSMSSMFEGATSFNQDVGNWNTNNVTDMSDMFYNANSFNQDIGNWYTGNVANMNSMFQNATIFNQNLSGWCVTNIVTEPVNFATGSALTTGNKPVWGTCP